MAEFERSSIYSSIEVFREGKDLAKKHEISIAGHAGGRLESITEDSMHVLSDLADENQQYIADKYNEIEDYVGLSYDELRNRHSNGFKKYLKQQYRLYKKENPAELDNLNNPEYIKKLASGYSFDFIRTLTLAKKTDITPDTALELADVAHWVNPNIILSLAVKYPDMDKTIIKFAAVNSPTNPEKFIEKVQENVSSLEKKYPGMNKSIIVRAAFGYPTNPERFIEKVQENVSSLEKKYPDVNKSIVKYAVVRDSTNPEKFIREYNKRLLELRRRRTDLSDGTLKKAAVWKNTDAALRYLLEGKSVEDDLMLEEDILDEEIGELPMEEDEL